MGKLIKTFEIDEFNNIAVIPDAAITQEIIDNIKNLNEKTEIEPFIREIIYDPNETPHGPTEIDDIISLKISAIKDLILTYSNIYS